MRLLIIGGSDAGISAELRARELDPTAEITLLVADPCPNFSICGIPYHVSGDVVNRGMRTNLPDVYPAGDCVHTYRWLLEQPAYRPLGSTDHKQG